jgi:hypothetical protein
VTSHAKRNRNSYEGTIMPLKSAKLCTALVLMLIVDTAACAADVTVTPAAGSGLVVKDAAGVNERMRVQESGAITLPGVPGAAAQATGVCISSAGLLGPCAGGSGGGTTYSAATGLALTGTAFSVAPTYQLPQGCSANQIAQWNGTAWACASAGGETYTAATGLALSGTAFSVAPTFQLPQGCSANQFPQWSGAAWACANASGGATLPTGTFDQTVRFNSSNTLVANSMLLAFVDGGLLAGGTSNVGSIPETGAGTRMMWYPKKEAFRAGKVGGTEWDDANVGIGSIAMGRDSTASGDASVAMGSFATASGSASTALGAATTASGPQATALGESTTASGQDSTAMGGSTTASGDWSTAMGQNTTADGNNSVAMGSYASNNGFAHSFIWSNGASAPNQVMNDAPGQFFVNGTSKFVGYMHVTGKLGVDSDLEVDGDGSFNPPYDSDNFFNASGLDADATFGCGCNGAAIYAPNNVVASIGFNVLSDARIKDITGRSDSTRDLVTLNAIEITDYAMKDRARFGNQRHKKVIAQQLEEVFPQLVSKHTGFIPDVYKVAGKVEQVEGGYKLSFDTPHGIAKAAKKLKLLPEGRNRLEQVDVLAVPSDSEVIVKASGWTAERVFVYGEEVDDLRMVDYDGLTALNVSATQELSKRLGLQQTQQSQLVEQLADKAAQIVALQEKLDAQQQQLATQRTELDAQHDRIAKLQTQGSEIAALRSAVAALQSRRVEPLLTTASAKLGRVEPFATNTSVQP